ncbi:sister chromatid cohesion protein Dcc1 [Kalaharituber pfeilii]|nr:sister chromatid cohesion protein Dcc1 [Kalaharituber pfeilii]
MSTQDHAQIPFSYSTPQAPIRLLELPPDLLSLIESESPPILKLKSTASSSTNSGHAVLCTPDQTYSIRQVQTSNSIYLLKPHLLPPESYSLGTESFLDVPKPGLAIVSTATSYLELLPTTPNIHSHLYKVLPVYHGWVSVGDEHDDDKKDGFSMQIEPPDHRGFSGIQDNTPASDGELRCAWNDIGCFEIGTVSYRPNAIVSLQLLYKISAASVLAGIQLCNPKKLFSTKLLWTAIDEESLPITLLEAFLRRVSSAVQGDWGNDEWSISKTRLAAVIGRLLLEADHDERKLIPKSVKATAYLSLPTFFKTWKEKLPDECQSEEVQLEMLSGWYYQPTSITVAWLEPGATPPADAVGAKDAVIGLGSGSGSGSVSTMAGQAGRGRGKWHEKFVAKKRKIGG